MAKRKLPAALKRKVYPDDQLAEIIGGAGRPRFKVLKDLWAYIRRRRLWDRESRRIDLDDAMQDSGIWGRKQSIKFTEVGKALRHVDE